ncbi:unnamed protein product [Schistosoma curassoni]|uniref:Uncharacterized protein n=1 Tax=Schistosoma curassoni TaxID=6186 RepID=A0A183JE98_9TREM|nr:unnamed protein product [Schistosoma curassoni]
MMDGPVNHIGLPINCEDSSQSYAVLLTIGIG